MKVAEYLENRAFYGKRSERSELEVGDKKIKVFTNEFWTSRQRQAEPIHEISYRACFKPQLPAFFISLLTKAKDRVYDPFMGRGTTPIEASLHDRYPMGNDINPLSIILCEPRLNPPSLSEVQTRLEGLALDSKKGADMDLSMFYHPDTEKQIVSLKRYLQERKESCKEDYIDRWIRMVATNRLTGHSPGFFSVYSLPPNQAVTPERQIKINQKLNQIPVKKDIKLLILKKSRQLLRNVKGICTAEYQLSSKDARCTDHIEDSAISLTVTSPPFLDIVQYSQDNWLRCWFNGIDYNSLEITVPSNKDQWAKVMQDVLKELYRITRSKGHVVFEVGEVRNGSIKLEEIIAPLGIKAGFSCEAIMINRQKFTKTANIWNVKNNKSGTNTNRIIIFKKERVE